MNTSRRTTEDQALIESAAREVIERSAKLTTSKVRFGAKPSGLHDDRLSTKPAPGPKGPETEKLLDWAKQRRRAQAEEERNRRG